MIEDTYIEEFYKHNPSLVQHKNTLVIRENTKRGRYYCCTKDNRTICRIPSSLTLSENQIDCLIATLKNKTKKIVTEEMRREKIEDANQKLSTLLAESKFAPLVQSIASEQPWKYTTISWNVPWLQKTTITWDPAAFVSDSSLVKSDNGNELIANFVNTGKLYISHAYYEYIATELTKAFAWSKSFSLPDVLHNSAYRAASQIISKVKNEELPIASTSNALIIKLDNSVATFEYMMIYPSIDLITGCVTIPKNSYKERGKVCADFAASYNRNVGRLKAETDKKTGSILLQWKGQDSSEIKSLTAKLGKDAVTVKTDSSHVKSAMTQATNEVIAQARERKRKTEQAKKEAEKKDRQRIKQQIASSILYGNLLPAAILTYLKESSYHHSATSIAIEMKEKFPHGAKEDVITAIEQLRMEGLIQSKIVDGKYVDYDWYYISDASMANAYINAQPIHYGKDKKYDFYSDLDWKALMENEDPSTLSKADWEKRTQILEHPALLEAEMPLVQKYFANAPDGVKEYVRIIRKMESSTLRKRLYKQVLGEGS